MFACVFAPISVDFLSLTVYLVDVSFWFYLYRCLVGLLFLPVTCIVTGLFCCCQTCPILLPLLPFDQVGSYLFVQWVVEQLRFELVKALLRRTVRLSKKISMFRNDRATPFFPQK